MAKIEFYTWENLPPIDLVSYCIEAGYSTNSGFSRLFNPISQDEAMEMVRRTYTISPSKQQSNSQLCEVLLLAATGSQYCEEPLQESIQKALFDSAKWYLDVAFGRDASDMQRMRCSMMVAIYLIFAKNINAMEYISQAMTIVQAFRQQRQHTLQHHTQKQRQQQDLRRAWQSLLFLDGYVEFSIFCLPKNDHSVDPYYHNDDALGPDLHSQLASLGVLMGAITADVVAPESVHINTIKTYSDRLKAWHANLPDCLTLSTAVRESYDSPLKNSTLLIHCAYLGSIILLTRRLHVERVAARVGIDGKFDASNHASGSKGDVQEDFSRMCVSAAGQLATVVGMLRTEHRLTRRCWLISQSSYTAALIISLEVAIHRGRPMLESAFTDNMSLISRCLPVLSHCASFDAVAARYLSILTPIHAALSAPQTNRRTHQQPSNEDLLDHILELMRTPFGGERGVLGPECDLFSVRGTLPEGWRFLVQPQPVFPGHGSSASSQSSGHSSGNRAKIDVEDNFSVAGGGGGGGGRKYPHRTREEYEAFFRRTT
ncbi:hypothetical protein EDC01DRAFT_620010 [Geopyxis carbonaria]|nr:hypothetical protein EDC01DRAFT_620010 [Geopyxis carbonaria]